VGSGTFRVRLHDAAVRPAAQRVLAGALGVPVTLDGDPVALSARGAAPERITRGLGELAEAGIPVEEFALGQPSLDEVFLALTGHPAEPAAGNGDRDDSDAHDEQEEGAA
jgi:ABC-2 type transport system ATP-binding protein